MREFFKPWRRKLGVMTLGLACVFTAGWVRSSHILDGIERVSAKGKCGITSVRGQLNWYYAYGDEARVTKREIRFPSFKLNPDAMRDPPPVEEGDTIFAVGDFRYLSRDQWWGHYSDLVQTPGPPVLIHTNFGQAPYWSIVLPLTLLSAYLLLSRPRLGKPANQPALELDHA